MNNTLDVRQLIDQQPIGRYQKWVVFLGFLIIALDLSLIHISEPTRPY